VGTRGEKVVDADDVLLWSEANARLVRDPDHTVELHFRLLRDNLMMDAKGIMVYDRATGQPSHSIWVTRPNRQPVARRPKRSEWLDGDDAQSGWSETSPGDQDFSADVEETILCRVCERQIGSSKFEEHSEVCVSVHRVELDAQLCADELRELKTSLEDKIVAVVDKEDDLGVAGEELDLTTLRSVRDLLRSFMDIIDATLAVPMPQENFMDFNVPHASIDVRFHYKLFNDRN
jgi:serine/threonine-protein kinase RIM15